MKFQIAALALVALLVQDAQAIKLTQKASGDGGEKEAELDATQEKLDEISEDVKAGDITEAQGQQAAEQIVHRVEKDVPEAAEGEP